MKTNTIRKIGIIDIIFIGFFFLFSTLSYAFIKNPYIRIIIEWLGFLSICFKSSNGLKIYKFDLLLLLFILLVIVEMFFNYDSSFFNICLLLPFLLLPLFSKENISYIDKLFNVFLIFDFIYALFTIVFSFSFNLYNFFVMKIYPQSSDLLIFWYKQRCNAGLVSHYTTNGILMITGIIILFANLLEKKYGSKKSKIYFIEFLVLTIGLLLTGKRAQLIFGFFSLLAGYFVFLSNKKKSRLFKIIGFILVVFVLSVALYNVFPSLFTFIDRFIQTTENGDVTLGRKKYWELAISIFKKHKLFGIGWGNFKVYSLDLYGKSADVHNNYLQLLCEVGIVGFVLFIIMSFVNIFRTIKIYSYIRLKNIQFEYKSLLLFSVSYQVFFLIYCFTGNPLYTNIVYIPYFLTYSVVGYTYYKYKRGDLHG